jgi:Ca-activated chloride channel family protein
MLRFQHISHLLALGIIPVLVLLFIWMLLWRRNRLKKLGETRLVRKQMRGVIPGRSTLKFILMGTALAAAIIGWANLQMGARTEKVERKGVDVIIALDVSRSMLAKDIQPDRLTRSMQLIMRMLDKMNNDRVGLVIFAGRAYLQVPLTVDYSALKMLLQSVRPDLIPTQGTVIGEAIDLSMKSFSQKEKKFKALVIISDGEDHDKTAIARTRVAADNGIIVHTVGVGSPQGSTLYDPRTRSVKLDDQGAPVISKLNEQALQEIASAGRGTYTLLNNADVAAAKLVNEIDGMEQKNLGAVVFTDYTSYFQYFLAVAFLLLVVERLLPGARRKPKSASV